MSSSRQVTDLGEFYARKGAEHERIRIIEWLREVRLQLVSDPVVEAGVEAVDDEGDVILEVAERRGALAIVTVLIDKIEAGE